MRPLFFNGMPDKQSAALPLTEKQRFEFNKLKKRLRRQVGEAIADYNMIQAVIDDNENLTK